MNRSLKIPYLGHVSLAQLFRHWTPKPVIISCMKSSPIGGNIFMLLLNPFDANTTVSANFVPTVKNSNGPSYHVHACNIHCFSSKLTVWNMY